MPEATGASRRLSSPWILLATALLGGMLALPALAIESSSAHYTNARSAMDNSGQTLSSPHFSNGSAVGEVSLTTHTSSGYNLRSGLMPIDYYPGAVTNFSASRSGSEQITLQWTAPGDDAHASGTTAKSYVIKYSTKASESPALSVSNFSSANSVPGAPAPQVEGTVQSLVFSGLIPGAQYYFAIRAFEDDGLAGTLSAGATVQAGACATTEYVKQAGGADATKIQDAINLLPKTLTGYSCIDIQDNGTYNEQVTVEGFTNNGSSITIETDPSVAGKAVIDPPGGSTAAFVIANSSVNLENLSVAPTTLVAYGVRVSSDFVTLSSMSVVDNGGPSQIWSAGVLVSASSGTVIEASTVTVARGDGLKLSGSTATAVSNSELTDSDFAGYPLYVHGGFSNSFTVVTASGSSSVRIDAGSQYDTISGSSFSAENFGGYALWINGASSNTVTDSYLSSPNGYGVFLDTGAEHNTITQSTAAAGGMGAYALFAQAASSNTISYSVLTSVNGTAVEMASEANWDTLGHDTISAPSGSGFNDALRVENSVHNTISHGVVKSSSGNALHLAVGADWNTIDNSTLLGSGSNNAGLFIDGGSSNTVSVSISSAAGGSGILLANSGGKGGDYNTITDSTMTASDGASYGLRVSAGYNTIENSYIYGQTNTALQIDGGATGTQISQSTAASSMGGGNGVLAVMEIDGAQTTLSGDLVEALNDADAIHTNGDSFTTITQSTMIAAGNGLNAGINLFPSKSASITSDYIQGPNAVFLTGSTDTVVDSNVLVPDGAGGAGIGLGTGGLSKGLEASQNVIKAEGTGNQGLALFSGTIRGSVRFSTNVVEGCAQGVYIETQAAAPSLWVTSNTIITPISSAKTTQGIYLDGLTTGATIYNNALLLRKPGSTGTKYAFGIYALSSSGLNIDRNRFDNPGMVTGGTYIGAGLVGTTNTEYMFNDSNSTGSLDAGYLLYLANGSVGNVMKDNVFLSGMTVTVASATVYIDGASGGVSDYNDYYSLNGQNTVSYHGTSYQFLGAWQTASGQDAHSIASDPLWHDVSGGGEDFHPASLRGRYDPGSGTFVTDASQSPTIDAGDPAEDYSLEPSPNGGRVNQGSYGGTAQASESAAAPVSPHVLAVDVSSITLAWTAVASDGYQVDASTASDFTGTVYSSTTASGAATQLAPQGLWSNTTYYLRVAALYSGSPLYDGAHPSTSTLALPVSGEQAMVWLTSITVNWVARPSSPPDASSATAEGYVLDISTRDDFTPLWAASSATPNVELSTLSISGLTGGDTYYLRVGAKNWTGLANYAVAVSTLLPVQLGVSLSTHSLSIPGLTAMNSTLVISTSIVALNTGNVDETYRLRATTTTAGSPWSIASSAGVDQYTLFAVVNDTQAASGDFNAQSQLADPLTDASDTVFTMGNQTAVNVPPGEKRTLWFKLGTPKATSTAAAQDIQIIAVPKASP